MQQTRQALTPRVVVLLLLVVVVMPLSPLLITGRWGWWQAWVYAAIAAVGFVLSRLLTVRHQGPGLLTERARFLDQPEAKSWDKVLSPIVGIGAGLVPLVAGLDVRWGWSPPNGLGAQLLGLALLLIGYGVATYALVENRYFSGVVRIQTERGHTVVSSGPYAWVRHPGYAGALVSYAGIPLLLDSRWALLVVLLLGAVLVVRTRLEDSTLQAELPGYREYAQKVRYRLLPGVW